MNISIEVQNTQLEFEGEYSDRMEEKFKREINAVLYSKDFYCFGYSLEIGLTELAAASKGVLQ